MSSLADFRMTLTREWTKYPSSQRAINCWTLFSCRRIHRHASNSCGNESSKRAWINHQCPLSHHRHRSQRNLAQHHVGSSGFVHDRYLELICCLDARPVIRLKEWLRLFIVSSVQKQIKHRIERRFFFFCRFHFIDMSGSTKAYADLKIQKRRVMMFAKANDPDSHRAKQILDQYHLSRGRFPYWSYCHGLDSFRYVWSCGHRETTRLSTTGESASLSCPDRPSTRNILLIYIYKR